MILKNNISYLYQTYESLLSAIQYSLDLECDHADTNDIDDLTYAVLKDNACFIDATKCKAMTYPIVENELYLYFIIGASANQENQFVDCISICGTTYVIVFLDYFKTLLTERITEGNNNIDDISKINFGNSNYYNALVYITSIICEILKPCNIITSSLAAGDLYRTAPSIISARIINSILPIEPVDIEYDSVVPFEQLKYFSNCGLGIFSARLLGIKTI